MPDKQDFNPFVLQGWMGPDYFCDRIEQVNTIKNALNNQRNVCIISLRRLGKSALIAHLFRTQRKFIPVFIDIYGTRSTEQLVLKIIAETVRQVGKPNNSLLKQLSQAMRSIEFSLSFDPISGLPDVSASIRPGKSETVALAELFRFLESRKKQVVIAIDEFQQVTEYPEDDAEAIIREHMQKLTNVNFIFSGSNRRMMQAIFADSRRPFYQSVQALYLGKIPEDLYADFIIEHFKRDKRSIPRGLVLEGLRWCRSHTYFVQLLFNRLYGMPNKRYSEEDMLRVQEDILLEKAPEYMQLKRLLSLNQRALLEAIGKEGTAQQPMAGDFIKRHHLSSASTVRQSLHVLLDKELVHEEPSGYEVTDVFLGRWLARL